MCSLFVEGGMGQNYQGDLTDIFRAGSGSIPQDPLSDWQFASSDPINISSAMEESIQYFGDPFSNMRDPFLNDLDIAGSRFFNTPNSADGASFVGGSNSNIPTQTIFPQIFPILPCDSSAMAAASPREIKASAMLPTDTINVNSSKGCSLDNTVTGVQISSPRNPVAVKRRKSQAKKVVCIPAPAALNSRPTGEVVPSDLWAWRKYGQKPIKGSPYPRGYYRCSSSKGCSARKQVERSRNDPNMLVITYTSEHNHPWPTQRNALAGSTRSQPSKNNINNASSASKTSSFPSSKTQKERITKDIESVSVGGGSSTTSACVKEEIEDIDKQMDIDDEEFSGAFTQSYRPAMPDNQSDHNLFADLEEIEAVSGNLLFQPEFNGDEQKESKTTLQEPFDLVDWSGDNNG